MFAYFLQILKNNSHLVAIFADFHHQYVKIGFFTLKKYFKMHVIRNTPCRFVCVRRTDMRQRAFESPDLGLCFKYPHHGFWMSRKFFTGPQRSGRHFFFDSVESADQNPEIFRNEKIEFWWSKWLEKIFFLNVSKVFGTWKNDVWDVFNLFRATEHL